MMKASFFNSPAKSHSDIESNLQHNNSEDSDVATPEDSLNTSLASESTVYVTLKEVPTPTNLLSSTIKLMIFYYFLLTALSFFIYKDMGRAKYYYRALRGDDLDLILFFFLVLMKVVIGFLGNNFRSILSLLYLVDCLLSCFTFLNIYFYFEHYERGVYRTNLHEYLIIITCLLFFSTVGLFISNSLKKVKRFKVFIGFLIPTFFLLLGLLLFIFKWATGNIDRDKFMLIFFIV